MSSRKSTNNSINIEDLIDDEATVEDFEEYNQIYPDVDSVTQLKNHCTSCFKHIGLSLAAVPKIRLHNILKVTICKTCHEFYNSGEFEQGEDGSELFCRWCGQGGVVLCCTKCIYVFCKECIKRNLGSSAYKKISNDSQWSCFRCNSNQLLDLRARHHVFTNYLLNRQNYVNETAKDATELKSLLLEDLSTCCRSIRGASEPEPSSSKSRTDRAPPPIAKPAPAAELIPKLAPPPQKKPQPASATPSSSDATPSMPVPGKRAREFVPGTAPGPLSKKLKALREEKDQEFPLKKGIPKIPKKGNIAPPKAQAERLKKKPTPPTANDRSRSAEPEEDQDLFSMLNPIIEMEVHGNDGHEVLDDMDPLDTDAQQAERPAPALAPTTTGPANNTPWRTIGVPMILNTTAVNGGQQWSPSPLNISDTCQSPLNVPDLDSFGFGAHFMAMSQNNYTPLLSPPPIQQNTFQPRVPMGMSISRHPGRPSFQPPFRTGPNPPFLQRARPLPPRQIGPSLQTRAPIPQARAPAGAPESVYHVVNGYRIDLKAASEQELITLPDGKVIHVRRHTSLNGPDAVSIAKNGETTQQPPPPAPLAQPPSLYGPRSTFVIRARPPPPPPQQQQPVRLFNTPPQIRVALVQDPMRCAPRFVPRPTPPLSVPVPPVHTYSRQKPRRKTTLTVRKSLPTAINNQDVTNSKHALNELLSKMFSTLTYTSQKCTTFQNTSVFKNARSMQDIIELHTNFGYIVAYAQQTLKDISDLNESHLAVHRKKHCAEKPSTLDELEVVESQQTYINLDSDDDNYKDSNSAGETSAVAVAQQKATTMIRCKTVSEINTTAAVAGSSKTKTLVVPARKKKKTASEKITAKKPELSESFIIDSSDSEAEVATKKTPDRNQEIIKEMTDNNRKISEDSPDNNREIIEDILGEIINSLFKVEPEKENTPPNSILFEILDDFLSLEKKEETPCQSKEAGKADPVDLTPHQPKACHEINLSCKETISENDRPSPSPEIKINGDIDESKADKTTEKDTSGCLAMDKPVIAPEVEADDQISTASIDKDGPNKPEEGNINKGKVGVSVPDQRPGEGLLIAKQLESSVNEEPKKFAKEPSCEIITLDDSMDGKSNEDLCSNTDTASEVSATKNPFEVVLEKEDNPMQVDLHGEPENKQLDAVVNTPQYVEETDPFADISDMFLVNEDTNSTPAATTDCQNKAEKEHKDVSMEEDPTKPQSDVRVNKPTADVLHNDHGDTVGDGVEPIEREQEPSLTATGSNLAVNGLGESGQMEVDEPAAESAVPAEKEVAKPTENFVAEQSMDEVFSAVETITKEIQRKEDSERGIDTSK